MVGRDSVRRYRQTKTLLSDSGRALDLDAMVTGSVIQSGDQKTLNLYLTRAGSDYALWSHAYPLPQGSELKLAVEVARTVAGQLRVGITPDEQAQLGDRPVVPEALEAYLQGKYRRGENPAERVKYFERAISLDNGFALAWQGLSDASWRMALNSQRRPSEVCPQAEDSARRAIELDDSLWEAHMALANVNYVCNWDFEGTEREIDRALALNPDKVNSNYQTWVGRFNVAIEAFTKGVTLDPFSPEARQNLGYVHLMSRKYDTAIEHYRQAIEMEPDRGAAHGHLALALAMTGQTTEAAAECETGLLAPKQPPGRQAALAGCAWIYAISGRRDDALRLMREIEAMAPAKWVDPLHLARIWDGLGDTEQALKKFQEAYDEHSPWMGSMRMWPMLSKQLRDDARFEALLGKVGTPIQSPPPPGFVRPVAK
jgi:tetratricopeptide (TPR) repeat protein